MAGVDFLFFRVFFNFLCKMSDNNAGDSIYKGLVPLNYLNIAMDAKKAIDKERRILFEKKKLPEEGWTNIRIEALINEIALMDTNNFRSVCGVGEREGRIICDLVARRHYNFAHGIGRSGDLNEAQPKAAGSTLMAQLTNHLLLDLIKFMGIHSTEKCILLPLATGMTMTLSLLAIKSTRPGARYVLWSRIDQKSCFKSIIAAGLEPIIIETILPYYESHSEPPTNIHGSNINQFEWKITELGAANIAAIVSTTSCFAPRTCDDIIALSLLAKESEIPHIINNAYGLQSTYYTHQIEQGNRLGRVDVFVQSTDKNLLVPVGGCILAGKTDAIDSISKYYPGRASHSQTLDVFMTLLSLGKIGYTKLVNDRKNLHTYFTTKLNELAEKYKENILQTKNQISIAFTLIQFDGHYTEIGSMLFKRGVSGCRVVSAEDNKTIESYTFIKWGGHAKNAAIPYLTVSAALGITQEEIDTFIMKLDNVLGIIKQKI